jgi:hypothetical protein
VYPNHSWQRDRNSPFAFFLGIISNYVHPDSGSTVDDLKELADYPVPSIEMVRFKDEFRRLLSGELHELPEYALFTAAGYDDGSDEAFLQRLWHELYGDEPVQPGKPVA